MPSVIETVKILFSPLAIAFVIVQELLLLSIAHAHDT